jgi:glycosyltransferase involved in cell wall biosynthesis
MLPDVTVIITCYNYGRYLERCLRSLYNQEHTHRFTYEIIIIDDNSDDETEHVSNKFVNKFDNLFYLKNIKNQGIAKSCNIAINYSSGRYLVRVDADDYISRHMIFLLKFSLDKNRNYQAFACDYQEVDDFENTLRVISSKTEEIACGVMYRREFLLDIGLYNEEFEYREGHELNKRFKEKYKIGYIPVPLYYARKHDHNRSANTTEIARYDAKLKGD